MKFTLLPFTYSTALVMGAALNHPIVTLYFAYLYRCLRGGLEDPRPLEKMRGIAIRQCYDQEPVNFHWHLILPRWSVNTPDQT
jgi:hypothetical protein